MAKGGRSNNKRPKKKGPRGKRARAKAQLDRQWGERVADGEKKQWRAGPSRLRQPKNQGRGSGSAKAAKGVDGGGVPPEDGGPLDGGENGPQLLLNETKDADDDGESAVSSSSSEDSDDDETDSNNATASCSTLLHSIRVASGKKNKNNDKSRTTTTNYLFDKDDDDETVSSSSSDDDGAEPRRQSSSFKKSWKNHPDDGNSMDTDDDDDDDNSNGIFIPSTDPFTSRFAAHLQEAGVDSQPLLLRSCSSSSSTDVVQQQAAARHRETVKLCLAAADDDNDDDNEEADLDVDVQVSKHLADSLQLPTKDGSNDDKNDSHRKSRTVQQKHRRRARRYLKSFYRTVLQRPRMPKSSHPSALPDALLPVLSSYADVLWTVHNNNNNHQSNGSSSSSSGIRELAVRHILNHVWTSRARIYQHDKRIHRNDNSNDEDGSDDNDGGGGDDDKDVDDEAWKRDQGFARPTVLLLLPTRHCCYAVVQQMQFLLGSSSSSSSNKEDPAMERFAAEYGPPPLPKDGDATNHGGEDPQERHRQKVLRQKGPAWNDLFGDDRNADDDFKLGVALHLGKKTNKKKDGGNSSNVSLKLFTDFYRSDIILASPLGLKMTLEADGDGDADFLSSIEICLIDRAEVLLEQNWDHVNDVLARLNHQPQSTHDSTDFSRVRPYFLQPRQAQHWRQLIVTSTILDPTLVSAFKRYAQSGAGVARVKQRCPVERASISKVLLPVRQVFQRVACRSFATQSEDRLQYFVDQVLPHLERTKQKHTLIFIPSYFDFCSLRNVLLKRLQDHPATTTASLDFCSVTEYARATEVSRGRARFLQGRRPLLLYTGRAHFFLRHAIRGVRHVIFYGVPAHPEFYSEHVNRLPEGLDDYNNNNGDNDEAEPCTCLTLYTKYDSHALERIVGTSNCGRMVKGDTTTYFFASS